MLKNWLKLPKNLYRRVRMARIIRRYDLLADQFSTHNQSQMINGVYVSTIDNLLETPGLSDLMRESDLRQPPLKEKAYFSWELPAFLWSAILSSKTLLDLVTEYLGPNVRLDDLYVKTVPDGYNSTSEGWHDDNVGYRIKVFMVFDTEGHPSGTLVLPQTRPNLYEVNFSDELARMLKKPKMNERPNQRLINYNSGDCLVFDTNVPHRGDYSSGQGIRYCVIAEFIDRNKADAIHGRAPCGPGQGKQKIKIPEIIDVNLKKHPLIDTSILEKKDHHYLYGY